MLREIAILLLVITLQTSVQAQVDDACVRGTRPVGNPAADSDLENVDTVKSDMKKDMKLKEVKACINRGVSPERIQNVQFILVDPNTGTTLELAETGVPSEELPSLSKCESITLETDEIVKSMEVHHSSSFIQAVALVTNLG